LHRSTGISYFGTVQLWNRGKCNGIPASAKLVKHAGLEFQQKHGFSQKPTIKARLGLEIEVLKRIWTGQIIQA